MDKNIDQSGATPAERAALSQPGVPARSDMLTLFDVAIALARRKKLLVGLPLVVGVLAAGISLAMPNWYAASTKLLPPQQPQSGASALLSQLGGATGLATGLAGVKSTTDVYIGMLKSRTVADRMIARFDLKKHYDSDSAELTRRDLAKHTVVASGKDGMISIEVEDKDPKLAAGLVNGYVEELERLTKTLAVTDASQRRLFFERQLETAKNNLAKVEIALKGAMNSGGVISVDSESRAILETAARVKAQVSAKEIQLGSMRAFVTAQNPEYQRAFQELNSLKAELAKLEGGRPESAGAGASRAGLENIQLMRDLKYYQMLYELLAKQYEMARLDEAKESSLIQVLDPALVPEFKSRPKRAMMVLGSTFLALLAAIAWILFSTVRQRALAVPSEAARWHELESSFKFR